MVTRVQTCFTVKTSYSLVCWKRHTLFQKSPFTKKVPLVGAKSNTPALDRLAEFLVRIQVHSPELIFLDGAWYRAFDYKLWEYYGSASDKGWGPWSIESGWTVTWISSVFALRQLNTSFWDISQQGSSINGTLWSDICTQMIPPEYC